MAHITTFLIFIVTFVAPIKAVRFDEIPVGSSHRQPVHDGHIQHYIRSSCRWLRNRAAVDNYPLLSGYAEQLQMVLERECTHCVDYYEAAGLLGLLHKTVNQIVEDGRNDIHQPVVRRSYLAALWLLQRSKMFVWETTHLQAVALSSMFRLYVGHVHRARGRAVSLHHISKCGGTTMCQLAASNRCSNPHLSQEKNCVLNDRLDGPLWMVGHHVTPQGVVLQPSIGTLDMQPAETPQLLQPRMRFANEPKMDMWLMYSCPYTPNGRLYNCKARAADAQESGTTFLANERSLTQQDGVAQVCREFINTVILREPVPHTVSLMAEVKYRYVRQMAVKHNIHSWQPSAWNLTWWEELGPALVGNYATRTLLGRESFCRSASNMSEAQLDAATDALLSFDVVMTLGRSHDIDLTITTLLGWPARNFSSQPGARVREVSVDLATNGKATVGDSKAAGKGGAGSKRTLLEDTSSGSSSGGGNEGTADDAATGDIAAAAAAAAAAAGKEGEDVTDAGDEAAAEAFGSSDSSEDGDSSSSSSNDDDVVEGRKGRSLLAHPQHNKHMHKQQQQQQHHAAGQKAQAQKPSAKAAKHVPAAASGPKQLQAALESVLQTVRAMQRHHVPAKPATQHAQHGKAHQRVLQHMPQHHAVVHEPVHRGLPHAGHHAIQHSTHNAHQGTNAHAHAARQPGHHPEHAQHAAHSAPRANQHAQQHHIHAHHGQQQHQNYLAAHSAAAVGSGHHPHHVQHRKPKPLPHISEAGGGAAQTAGAAAATGAGTNTSTAAAATAPTAAAAAVAAVTTSPSPAGASPVSLSPEELERQAAIMLVTTTWQERQSALLGASDPDSLKTITGKPIVEHMGQRSEHGAHLVKVTFMNEAEQQVTEVWHSFPRHTFAFLAADVAHLEQLTRLDAQLYETASLMFDLDAVWLQAMMASPHYRKKLRAVAATYTSCGFAGMMPVEPGRAGIDVA